MMSDPDVSSRKPASSPRQATRDLQEPSASLPPRPVRATAPTEPTRPTWGELAFKKEPIPLDESLQKASRDLAVKGARAGADEGLKVGREDHGRQRTCGRPRWRPVRKSLASSIPRNAGSSIFGFPTSRAGWSRSTISIPT